MPEFDDFESYVLDAFDQLETWYGVGLQDYEYIRPDSAIGKIVVDLYTEREASIELCEDYGMRFTTETDRLVHADDIGAAGQAYERAELRHQVFDEMYSTVLTEQALGVLSYQVAVSEAVRKVKRNMDNVPVPPDEKAELMKLAYEISCFLTLEEEQHFRDLIWPLPLDD